MTDLEYACAYEHLRRMRRQKATAEINGDFAKATRLKQEIESLSLGMADSIMAAANFKPRDSAGRFVSRAARP